MQASCVPTARPYFASKQVKCVCVILYGEWPSTRALGARLQWPGKHLTSVPECEWWKQRDKYSLGSHSSAQWLMNLSSVPAVGTQVSLRWCSVWPEVELPVVHNAVVVVLKAVGRVLPPLLVEVRFELWKEKRTNQLSVGNCVEFELIASMTVWVAVQSGINLKTFRRDVLPPSSGIW